MNKLFYLQAIFSITDITKDTSVMMADSVEHLKKIMGEPRNYGKSVFTEDIKVPFSLLHIAFKMMVLPLTCSS